MLRRELLEVLGVYGVGSRIGSVECTRGSGSLDVELLVALPDEPGEYTVRVMDDEAETFGYWRGSVKKSPTVVSGGVVDVRSNHVFVRTDGPSKGVSGSFIWIEGISKLAVDFPNETLHLIYRGTDREKYWNARKKST